MSDFIRKKIKETVNDAEVAKLSYHMITHLVQNAHRLILNILKFNREMSLSRHQRTVISTLTDNSKSGDKIQADIIVFATGFDAMTGSLLKLGIVGSNNLTADAWQNGREHFWDLAQMVSKPVYDNRSWQPICLDKYAKGD